MKIVKRLLIVVAVILLVCQVPFSCAQRGFPTGGPKDTIPPSFVNARPANYSTHFNSKIIRINFDEFIKLKEPDKQILISPPMETRPLITPLGQASEYVEIEILDTLKPNTTYTVNFGQSVVDNNEGNPLPFFKYVFSTGDYIDSLRVSGEVTDAFYRQTESYISVMLYKLDSTYSDSIVYRKPPSYIAYTKDSINTFTIENIAEGDYMIVALKDDNRNYLFNPEQDKIGFLTDTIHLPTDKTFELTVFKEILDFEPVRPDQVSKQHLLFGFEGRADSVQIRLLSEAPEDFRASYYKQPAHDSIDYWFTPYFETDSLVFEITKGHHRDTVITRLTEMDPDSLQVIANPTGTLPLNETFSLSANTPLVKIDTSFITLINKDSVAVPFSTTYKLEGNQYIFDFEVEEEEVYAVKLLPGALTDFYGEVNDTLNFQLHTKAISDYANVRITLQNIKQYPVIVQLTNKSGETKRERIHHKDDGAMVEFKFVKPGIYFVRAIYDANDNGRWDTGDYLKKRQPETVIYMDKPLDVRANWEISQTFMLIE